LLKIGQKDHGNRDGETIWALKDVSFEVEQASPRHHRSQRRGKSTTAQIITGVDCPTSGQIKAKGRSQACWKFGTWLPS